MPQLHDSGNRHVPSAQPSAHADGCARIFGLETEYGMSVTGADRPCDIGQVAMSMFRPIVRRQRSTNTYLDNGSRLYLDVGSHPEYATAEALTPTAALLADAAGESVMRALALDAQRELRASLGDGARLHLFKNNADSAGHSYGCHENYLVRRYVDLHRIRTQLLPFLITRQIYTGAGRFDGRRWTYTQRARFVDETVSSATTRSRPMINTRDEPHADPETFRRLHVIIGDSNRSQWATAMKCATTHLVLCALEDRARRGEEDGLSRLAMADPVAANLAVNEKGPEAVIELARGGRMNALDMQRAALDAVCRFVDDHADEVADSLRTDGTWSAARILQQWRWALERLGERDVDALSHVVDWACKLRFFDRLESRGAADPMRVAQLDLDYHDIVNGTLFPALVRRGLMRSYADADQVARAVHTPPEHTRAVLRGRFVREAQAAEARYACDWTQLKLVGPPRRSVQLLDPFRDTPDEGYERLMEAIGARG